MNWAVIGAGDIVRRQMIPALGSVQEAKIACLVGRRSHRLKQLAEEYAIPKWSIDPQQVLDSPEIEAVYIATPPHLHAELSIQASSAGKHVLCEKPMAMTEAEAISMVTAAETSGRLLAVAHHMRFHSTYQHARRCLSEGMLGHVRMVTISHMTSLPAWFGGAFLESFRLQRASGGGTIMDMGIHDFDGIRFILGEEITQVSAFGGPYSFPCDVDDNAVVAFLLQGGALGSLSLSFDTPGGQSMIHIHGTCASLIIEQKAQADRGSVHLWRASSEASLGYPAGNWEPLPTPSQNPYVAQIKHFEAAARGEEKLLISGLEGLRSLRVALAALRSIVQGKPARV